MDILGIGNPLLDLTMFECQQLLAKYNLEENNQTLARPEHRALFEEVTSPPNTPLMVPGGATQNSIRVAQWILKEPNSTGFIGAIGDDDEGHLLERVAEECGMRVAYQVRPGERTGICVALITGENRTLVTSLGAAVHLDADVVKDAPMAPLVRSARIIYVGGYLWSSSPANITAVARLATQQRQTLAMNLHAQFLCPFFASAEYGVLPHIDYLFGNEREALTFARCLADSTYPFAPDFQRFRMAPGPTTEVLADIAERVAVLPGPDGRPGRRRVVFTCGREPLVYVDGDAPTKTAQRVAVEAVPKEEIKDTNGCGDAFVGGFLAQVARGASIERAVRCGMFASRTVIRHYGCTFPARADFEG